MINDSWFILLLGISLAYMFISGGWKEFGNKHPAIAFAITVFAPGIIALLLRD